MGSGNEGLVGTWRLVSCFMQDIETKERKPVWGEHPNGFIVLTAGGRWIVIQTAESRKAPLTDEDYAAAFRSMLAYSGIYRTDGNKILISVDIAWDESWNGTEQVRYYRIEGDRLHIEAAPQPYANFGGSVMRGILSGQETKCRRANQ
jgi:lipocalin-like protein